MPDIIYAQSLHPGFIILSDEFILQHMPSANGSYVKVFLYAYQQAQARAEDQSTEKIARTLGMIESDVLEAFRYWEQKGLMHLTDQDGHLELQFEPAGALPPVRPTPPSGKKEKTKEKTAGSDKVVKISSRPTYSPEELNLYSEMNPDIASLFEKAMSALGAPLSPANLSILYSFYDYYCLPIDVIDYLIDYCVSNGGRTMRYMEKVVQDWEEQKINTVEAAKEYVSRYAAYRPIRAALHLAGPRTTEKEEKYFSKWLNEYQMPMDVILEACSRTYANTGGPKLNYCDKILSNWYDEGVNTIEKIASSDEAHKGSGASHEEKSKNTFLNYTQHDEWNYDELERLSEQKLYQERK